MVKPATVIQWHRQGFRLFWRWRSRSGRPSVEREIRDLIRQMSSANPLWGAPRIHGSCSSSASRSVKLRSPSIWSKTRCAFPDLAHLPAESRRRHRCHRHARRAYSIIVASRPICRRLILSVSEASGSRSRGRPFCRPDCRSSHLSASIRQQFSQATQITVEI